MRAKRLAVRTVVVCLFLAISLRAAQREPAPTVRSLPAAAESQASVPRLIRFSGIFQNLAGKPITGPVDVTFSLYADEAGGSPLWFETQTVQADSFGHYTVLLGAMTPTGVPMELFTEGQAHWMGVQVSNLPEQSRVLLVSVPYAIKAGDAETLGGRPASEYQLTPDANSSSDSTGRATAKKGTAATTDSKKPTKNAESSVTNAFTQNYIPVFADNTGNLTNSIMVQSGTKIGINTNAPAFNLDLNGAVFAVGPKTAAPGQGGTMRFRDDTGTQRWLFGLPGSAGSQDFQMYNYSNGHAPLFIQNGAASYSLYLAGSGNVGVGTASPASKLDVSGTINASSTVTAAGLNLAQTTSSTVGVITLGGLRFIHNCCLPGQGNIFMGLNAGNFTMTGSDNTIIGGGLQLNSTGMRNSALGEGALAYNSSGNENTAAGVASLYSNQDGSGNTSLGYSTMFYNTSGNNNTVVGYWALYANTTGSDNTAIGLQALHLNTTGAANTATGRYTLSYNTTGAANTAIGETALGSNTTGNYNTAVGSQALSFNTTGSYNSVLGPSAMLLNTTGGTNTAVGNLALRNNTTGGANVALGDCALLNTTGSSSTTSSCSLVPGAGYANVGVGMNAGHTNTTGQSNTFIGYGSDAGSSALTNATAIGAYATVSASNALVLGAAAGQTGAVNVGIGTAAPTTTLQVAGGDVSTTTAGKGMIVKSPDGTKCARIGIDNSGTLVAASVACP